MILSTTMDTIGKNMGQRRSKNSTTTRSLSPFPFFLLTVSLDKLFLLCIVIFIFELLAGTTIIAPISARTGAPRRNMCSKLTRTSTVSSTMEATRVAGSKIIISSSSSTHHHWSAPNMALPVQCRAQISLLPFAQHRRRSQLVRAMRSTTVWQVGK